MDWKCVKCPNLPSQYCECSTPPRLFCDGCLMSHVLYLGVSHKPRSLNIQAVSDHQRQIITRSLGLLKSAYETMLCHSIRQKAVRESELMKHLDFINQEFKQEISLLHKKYDQINNYLNTILSQGFSDLTTCPEFSLNKNLTSEDEILLRFHQSGFFSKEILEALINNYDNKHSAENVQLLNSALEIQHKLTGNYSTEFSDLLAKIAIGYEKLGEYEKSLKCSKECLDILNSTPDTQDNSTSKAMYLIGKTYEKMASFGNAEFYLDNAIKLQRKNEDMELAKSLNCKGLVLFQTGKYKDALFFLEKSLGIKDLFSDSSEIAETLNNIASVYEKIGKYDEALQYHQRALKLQSSSEERARTELKIGIIDENTGNYTKSLETYSLSLETHQLLIGREHPDSALVLIQIGSVLNKMERYTESLANSKEALDILTRVYGEKHPSIATVYNNIGISYEYMKECDNSLLYMNRALSMRQDLFGELHLDVAQSLNSIGNVYDDLSMFQESYNSHKQALDIVKTVIEDPEHALVARSLCNIGNALDGLKRHQEALEAHTDALRITKHIRKENHPSIGICLSSIGIVYFNLDRFEEALQCFQESLRIYEDIYSEDGFHILKARYWIERTEIKMKSCLIF